MSWKLVGPGLYGFRIGLSATVSQTSQEHQPYPNANIEFYELHLSDANSVCGLATLNNQNLYGLCPLSQRLFCAPATGRAKSY